LNFNVKFIYLSDIHNGLTVYKQMIICINIQRWVCEWVCLLPTTLHLTIYPNI